MKSSGISEAVIWHDVENGAYDADLATWRELAASASGPILDLGCGTGRAALDLAQSGHRVLGVDIELPFVSALRERAAERKLEASAVVGDIRDLRVAGEFSLVVVPMQTIQLLEDPDQRRAALTGMRKCLASRGLIAVAIVEGDLGAGDPGFGLGRPLPDVGEIDGWIYSSLPTELQKEGDRIVVSRLRQVVAPGGDLSEERSELTLAILAAETLEAEAVAADLRPAGRRKVPETDSHVGSTIVLLEGSV